MTPEGRRALQERARQSKKGRRFHEIPCGEKGVRLVGKRRLHEPKER